MYWLNLLSKWELIFMCIGLAITIVLLITLIGYWLIKVIIHFYKSHSKKYEYNCVLHEYVKKKGR